MNIRELLFMVFLLVEEFVMRNYSVSVVGEIVLRLIEVFYEVNFGKIINSFFVDDGSRWYYFGNLVLVVKDVMMGLSFREFVFVDRIEDCNLFCFVNQVINVLVYVVQNINEYFCCEWNFFNDIFKQEVFEVLYVEFVVIVCIKGEDICIDYYLFSSYLGYLNEDLICCDDKKIVFCYFLSLIYIK